MSRHSCLGLLAAHIREGNLQPACHATLTVLQSHLTGATQLAFGDPIVMARWDEQALRLVCGGGATSTGAN